MKNIQKITNEILKIAVTIHVPEEFNGSNEELAKWVEKQNVGFIFDKPIFNLENGEILLEMGESFSKYEKYSIPRLLRGQSVRPKSVEEMGDPREHIINFNSFKKYYKIINKNGIFTVSRSDLKPFEQYDAGNVELEFLFTLKLHPEDLNAEQFVYDYNQDIPTRVKYIKIAPTGLNKNYLLENFEDFYDIETKPLKTWFEEDTSIYSEYDGDAEIPVKMTKKDKTVFSKDDLEIVKMYLKKNNNSEYVYGGANIRLIADVNDKVLGEENLIMEMVR
jgi:hypothetical protein